jgi:hypothetical protein
LKDETTLEEYKIEDKQTVHLVRGKSASGAPPTGTQPTAASTGA